MNNKINNYLNFLDKDISYTYTNWESKMTIPATPLHSNNNANNNLLLPSETFKNLLKPCLTLSEANEKITKEFDQLFENWIKSDLALLKLIAGFFQKYCYIAGGYIRDCFLTTVPKDIDIYFISQESIDLFTNNIINKFPKVFKKTNLGNYNFAFKNLIKLAIQLESKKENQFLDLFKNIEKFIFIPINLITYKNGPSKEVIETFDFVQNSFAYNFNSKLLETTPSSQLLFSYPAAGQRILWQSLRINQKVDNPLSALVRSLKFVQEKGYKISKSESMKLAKLISQNSSNQEKWLEGFNGES